jgi:streptogramin lyase
MEMREVPSWTPTTPGRHESSRRTSRAATRVLTVLVAGALSITPVSIMSVSIMSASVASAAPVGDFTTYAIGPANYGGNAIAAGPDGNMWFTDNANNAIGRITPAGATTFFPVPTTPDPQNGFGLFEITAGPDGNMWFTAFYTNMVGKINMSGVITTYALPTANSNPLGITAGPDGNMWVALTSANGITRINPTGTITQFPIPAPGSTGPTTITVSNVCPMCGYLMTAGPDNSVWFTIPTASRIGRITGNGVVTTFPVDTAIPAANAPQQIRLSDITTGTDGNLWFTEPADNQVGRMTTAGAVTEFTAPVSNSAPNQITIGFGSDLWITLGGANALAKVTLAGAIDPVTLPTANAITMDLAVGPDGNLWSPNLVTQPSSAYALQIDSIGTGSGPILQTRVKGTAKIGSGLSCAVSNTSGWTTETIRYQWLRNGKAIPSANNKTFTPRVKDVRTRISCRASVTFTPVLNTLGTTSTPVRVRR